MNAAKYLSVITLAVVTAAPLTANATSPRDGAVEVLTSEGRVTADGTRKAAGAPALTAKSAAPERGDNRRLDRKAPVDAPAESLNQEFWIYDAQTAISGDLDGDGFFTRLELDLDADTVYDSAWVYAVVYLSLEGGDWVEYGETAVFDIYGASGNDVYFFDADLVSGFPTGYYDVLIDLYDDYDGRLVATFGPAESADLFDLPLESESVDSPVEPVIIVTEEGGGGGSVGAGLLGLLALGLSLGALRRRQSLDVAD